MAAAGSAFLVQEVAEITREALVLYFDAAVKSTQKVSLAPMLTVPMC